MHGRRVWLCASTDYSTSHFLRPQACEIWFQTDRRCGFKNFFQKAPWFRNYIYGIKIKLYPISMEKLIALIIDRVPPLKGSLVLWFPFPQSDFDCPRLYVQLVPAKTIAILEQRPLCPYGCLCLLLHFPTRLAFCLRMLLKPLHMQVFSVFLRPHLLDAGRGQFYLCLAWFVFAFQFLFERPLHSIIQGGELLLFFFRWKLHWIERNRIALGDARLPKITREEMGPWCKHYSQEVALSKYNIITENICSGKKFPSNAEEGVEGNWREEGVFEK